MTLRFKNYYYQDELDSVAVIRDWDKEVPCGEIQLDEDGIAKFFPYLGIKFTRTELATIQARMVTLEAMGE